MQGIYREIQKEYDDSRKRALDEVEDKKQRLYKENEELKNLDDLILPLTSPVDTTILILAASKPFNLTSPVPPSKMSLPYWP